MAQAAREKALTKFREGKIQVLVATDVAARGIDVAGVTHVINYTCPEDEKTYVHRIGRTGRAGATGIAVTFVDWADLHRWKMINKALDLPFDEPRRPTRAPSTSCTTMGIAAGHQGPLIPEGQAESGRDSRARPTPRRRAAVAVARGRGRSEGGRSREPRRGRASAARSEPTAAAAARRRRAAPAAAGVVGRAAASAAALTERRITNRGRRDLLVVVCRGVRQVTVHTLKL